MYNYQCRKDTKHVLQPELQNRQEQPKRAVPVYSNNLLSWDQQPRKENKLIVPTKEHDRIFGQSYTDQTIVKQRGSSQQKSSVFDHQNEELIFTKPRNNQTFVSSALDQSQNEQLSFKTGKRAVSAPKQPEPKQHRQHPLKTQDHRKEYIFHVSDIKKHMKSFEPNYKKITAQQQRNRDFIHDQIGTPNKNRETTKTSDTNKFKNTSFSQKHSNRSSNPQSPKLNSQWKKQDFLQSSELFSKSLNQNYDQWKKQQQHTKPIYKDTKPIQPVQQHGIHRTDLMPSDFSWATFDSIKNQKDVDQSPSLQRNMSLPPPPQIPPARSLHIITPNQSVRELKSASPSPQKQKPLKMEVEVITLDVQGMKSDGEVEGLAKLCNKQGFHVVHCRTDYNKLTNQLTGDSSLLLRRSYNQEESPKFGHLKKEIQQRGLVICDKENKLGLVDMVPNQYIRQTQMDQRQSPQISKRQVNKLYSNYYRFQKSRQKN